MYRSGSKEIINLLKHQLALHNLTKTTDRSKFLCVAALNFFILNVLLLSRFSTLCLYSG